MAKSQNSSKFSCCSAAAFAAMALFYYSSHKNNNACNYMWLLCKLRRLTAFRYGWTFFIAVQAVQDILQKEIAQAISTLVAVWIVHCH